MQENGYSQNENEANSLKTPEPSLALQLSWVPGLEPALPTIDEKALRMMQNMGYKLGSGLGKNEQGITEAIKVDTNLGKRGLGLKLNGLNLSDGSWDFSQEDIEVNEKVQWLKHQNKSIFTKKYFEKWIKEGPPNNDIVGNSSFCDREVLQGVFKAKDIFDELGIPELNQARSKANPFETIRSAFFMNRAALKMANIDAACDFMFTTMEENEGHYYVGQYSCKTFGYKSFKHLRSHLGGDTYNMKHFYQEGGPIYFADVCAGPGGFTEYILWRKQWLYKGFGLTLKDEHDFKVSESTCASSATFQALYGVDGLGDVCNPDNLQDFTDRLKNETVGSGVHFMMSDGGFCVDGQENLQEVLSKNIYLCPCLLALNILRPHGNFVTKLFDIFTPFSVGLLYLMHLCFEKVGIIKPNSSRPANSERYFVCNNFKVHSQTNIIREYLCKIATRLWEIKTICDRDLLEIVPLEVLKEDGPFFDYIFGSNTSIGRKQILALKKLARFCRNPKLIDPRQEDLRRRCLKYWNIPDKKKTLSERFKVENVLAHVNLAPDVLRVQPRYIDCKTNLEYTITDVRDWHYTYLYSSESTNRTNFYAGIGFSKVYRLQNNKWAKIKDLELNKGTLLYGELVKETSLLDNKEVTTRYSLHVIDAVYLGSMNLQTYTFQERLEFIRIFCKAVNKESQSEYTVRVRAKDMRPLSHLPQDFSVHKNADSDSFSCTLPRVGYKSACEKYDVNSILLMKTNNSQSFQSTHVLRIQIFNSKNPTTISFDELAKTVDTLSM